MMGNKTFRLFISSTFSDFEKEREILHKKVFPAIEKHCNENNLTFQPVDLRWGVNEEAQLDQKTLEVCLEEVRACKHFPHPNFLIMAGDRYGYVPCPYMIEESEFEKIYDYVKNNNKKIVIQYDPELDSDKEVKSQKEFRTTTQLELLESWYALDKNQIYLTDKNTSTAYIHQVREDDYKIYVNWQAEENLLRDMLQEAVNYIFTTKEDKEYQKYFLSATEQEVLEGICDFKDKTESQKDCDGAIDKKYIFGYMRTIIGADDKYIDIDTKEISDPKVIAKSKNLQKMADEFKKNLQSTLDKDNICPAEASSFTSIDDYEKSELDKFEEYITQKLKDAIDDQVKESKEISKLEEEQFEQKKFIKDKVKGFQGREETLDTIENYIETDITEPLIIHGPSGMGKSSLMAEAIFRTDKNRDKENKNIKTDTLFRFVGATANSTTIRNLLISIVDELQDKKIIEQIDEYQVDDNKFYTQVKDILLSIEEKTTIFIDALDQLQHINYLNWLPSELPSNLKIILTVLNDKKHEKDTHYYNLLNQRYDNPERFIDITKDSLEKNKKSLIVNLLEVENRQLDEYQTNYLLEKWGKVNYSPLYLKIAIEEVKHWKAKDISQQLNDSVEGIISEYLKNLKKLYHHEELLIKKVFGYIHASKDGLSERELLHILSEDLEDDEECRKAIINEYHKAIKVTNPRRDGKEEHILPISIWSRLHTQIKPFIIERNIDNQPLIKFFHRQFTTVVEEFYTEDEKEALHTKMADYFLTLQDKTKVWDKRYDNLHMLDELPYQLFHAKDSKRLKEIFSDLEFSGSIYDNHKEDAFREILKKSIQLNTISEDEIYPWKSFYREKAHLIKKVDEKKWRPHQSLFQLAYEDGENSPVSFKAKILLHDEKVNFSWVKNNTLKGELSRSGMLYVFDKHTTAVNGVECINNKILISYSDNGTMYLWNIEGSRVLELKGHTASINGVVVIDNNHFLSYSNDCTIRIWNISGEVIKILRVDANIDNIVYGIKLYKDQQLFSYSVDNSFILWNFSGEKLVKFVGHQEVISGIQVLDDGRILSYSTDSTIRIWSIAGKELLKFVGHTQSILDVIVLENNLILSSSRDNTLRIWDLLGNNLVTLNVSEGVSINGLKILKDGSILAYLDNGFIQIWDTYGKQLALFQNHQSNINGVKLLKNEYIISFASDGSMYLYDYNGVIYSTFRGHTNAISGLEILQDGKLLSYSEDRTLKLWDQKGELLRTWEGHTSGITGITILNENIISYAGQNFSPDNTIRIWNYLDYNKKNTTFIKQDEGHGNHINGVKTLSNNHIVSYADDNKLILWTNKKKILKILKGHTAGIKHIKLFKDERILSYSNDLFSNDNSLILWNKNGDLQRIFNYDMSVKDVKIIDEHTFLVLYGNLTFDDTIVLWDTSKGLLKVLDRNLGSVNTIMVLNKNNIIFYSNDNIIRNWSLDKNDCTDIVKHKETINGLDIYDKGILFYSGSMLYCYDIQEKKLILFESNISEVEGIKVLKNGNILSYHEDYTLHLWKNNGLHITTMGGHTKGINNVTLLKNGNILSSSYDSTVHLWSSEGILINILRGHTDYVYFVHELQNNMFLTFGHDKTLRLWNKKGNFIDLFVILKEEFHLFKMSQDMLIAGNGSELLFFQLFYGNKKFDEVKNLIQEL